LAITTTPLGSEKVDGSEPSTPEDQMTWIQVDSSVTWSQVDPSMTWNNFGGSLWL
jgi:hypothetical protein